jgi:hypothetical protein
MEKVNKKGYEDTKGCQADLLYFILTYMLMLHWPVIARGLTLRWMHCTVNKKMPE